MENAESSTGKPAPECIARARNEAADLLALVKKTGYEIVHVNGQRIFGSPCPGWAGRPPRQGCEVFVGNIPRDVFEDELVPVFMEVGKIYEFRLMMDFSGNNRGYAFARYTNREDGNKAVKQLSGYEIRKGRYLGVYPSVDNCRLFVGGIPNNKKKEEILDEVAKVTEGVVDVTVCPLATDNTNNRGFAFIEYKNHWAAAMARQNLIPGGNRLWGCQIKVDWAKPEQDVDKDIMKTVKILYVRNLMKHTKEETIWVAFDKVREGCVKRVKKLGNFAFVHFRTRADAHKALETMNEVSIDGSIIEVVLAKPVNKNALMPIPQPIAYGYGHDQQMAVQQKQPCNRLYRNISDAAGRGGLAAGMRGTDGMHNQYYVGQKTTESRLYDIIPGMLLTPTDPVTLKPLRSFVQSRLYDIIPGMLLTPTDPVTLKPLRSFVQSRIYDVPVIPGMKLTHTYIGPSNSQATEVLSRY